jgi:hypothetical protein
LTKVAGSFSVRVDPVAVLLGTILPSQPNHLFQPNLCGNGSASELLGCLRISLAKKEEETDENEIYFLRAFIELL